MMVAMLMRARLNLNEMKQRMTDGRTYPPFGCNFQDAYKACIIWIMKAHTARSTDMPMHTLVGITPVFIKTKKQVDLCGKARTRKTRRRSTTSSRS